MSLKYEPASEPRHISVKCRAESCTLTHRCTSGTGSLSAQTWEQLQLLDAGSHFGADFEVAPKPPQGFVVRGQAGLVINKLSQGERIPTLTALVCECKQLGLGLMVEIKHSNDDATAVSTLNLEP